MVFPNDPFMLLSVVNTALRDKYASLEALEDDADGVSAAEITEKLDKIGYVYDEIQNRFITK